MKKQSGQAMSRSGGRWRTSDVTVRREMEEEKGKRELEEIAEAEGREGRGGDQVRTDWKGLEG